MSANADSVGFKLSCSVRVTVRAYVEKLPVFCKTFFLQTMAFGLIQESRATVIFGI